MKISINGINYEVDSSSSITQALEESNRSLAKQNNDQPNEQRKPNDFVIALNQTFVPRSQYSSTQLQDNDVIELLSPMAGG